MRARTAGIAIALALMVSACGSTEGSHLDAGIDAGRIDAGSEAGSDAGSDAGGLDAGIDAAVTMDPCPGASIAGRAFLTEAGGAPVPQRDVQVRAYDETAGGVLRTEVSTDAAGLYCLYDLPPSLYTLTGCLSLDGTEYFYAISGVSVSGGGGTVTEDLTLTAGPCP